VHPSFGLSLPDQEPISRFSKGRLDDGDASSNLIFFLSLWVEVQTTCN